MRIGSLSIGLAAAVALACAGVRARPSAPAAADRPASAPAPRRAALGAGSCAAAACHGGGAEVGGDHRSRLAHTIWASRDEAHPRAFEALRGARSAAILKNLRWARPAHEEPRCLACHATPTGDAGEATAEVVRREGVGCEACHGPAGGWLVEHARPSWADLGADAKWKTYGMVPTKALGDRVRVCSGCHVGDPGNSRSPFPVRREVDHDMIAAGHPRLNFEFASSHDLMPRHWDETPEERTPEAAARRWLVGRIGAEVAALDLLHDRASRAEREGAPWPEFSEYDCFSCHHGLRDETWRRHANGKGRAAGEPSWGTWYFSDAPLVSGPESGGLLQELRRAMQAPAPAAGEVATRAATAREALIRLPGEPAVQRPTRADIERLIRGLDPDLRPAPPADWDAASQAYLGLVQLRRGGGDADRDRLRQMGRDLGLPANADSPAGFDPTRLGRPAQGGPARSAQ